MNAIERNKKKLQFESYHLQHELERFSAQIKFVEGLMELHPKEASKWKSIINKASACIDELPELSDHKKLKNAVRKAEEIMKPLAKSAKKYTIHCVGHAHIDMNWMWSWPETVAVTNDTFSTVLKLMEEYPEFTFSQSQASVYEIIEKYNPSMLKKIKERVKEKRWEVTASHWVEGDKNMINGETLTRHLLYTRDYMKKLFDLKPEDVEIDWAPDTFGHAATMPTYLAQGGIKYCYLHRPGHFGEERPGIFRWKGPDGSEVLVRNDMIHAYNGRVSAKIAENLINFVKKNGSSSYMFVYGIGDHGGGPTRCDLNKILDMASWPIFPEIKFSTAHSFFKAFESESSKIPVLKGELNVEFTGCYTSQALIKKANRYSENALVNTEFANLISWKILKQEYPHEKLTQNWKDCMFNHFHDILPGSGVRDTRHYTMGLFQNIMADTSMMETLALRQIASVIDTSVDNSEKDKNSAPPTFYKDAFGAGAGIDSACGNLSVAEQSSGSGERPFVIFNPTSADRSEVIEITIWDNPVPGDITPLKDRQYAVITPEKKLIPAQFIAEGKEWAHRYVKLAFPVKIKKLSYASYTIVESEAKDYKSSLKLLQSMRATEYLKKERATAFGCENEYALLEINPVTGGIYRLKNKKTGQCIISPECQAPMLEYAIERPHRMSSWFIDFDYKKSSLDIKSISHTITGPYKIGIKVDAEINNSKFSVIYEMEENSPLINIKIKGTWLETGNEEIGCPTLRMPFALNLDSPEASYEIPFGAIKRDLKNDEEVPALQWAKVTGGKNKKQSGFLLLNDCKHGYAMDGNTLRMSLIRGSYNPDPTPELGEHEMRIALLPISGELSNSECSEYGQNFNRKLKAIGTSAHKGKLPKEGELVKISGAKALVSGLKKAENEDAVVMRLYEIEGKKGKVKIEFNKAFGTPKKALLVDLMERPIKGAPAPQIKSGNITVDLPANGILSFMILFK
jgi:alpha-mannosidase